MKGTEMEFKPVTLTGVDTRRSITIRPDYKGRAEIEISHNGRQSIVFALDDEMFSLLQTAMNRSIGSTEDKA